MHIYARQHTETVRHTHMRRRIHAYLYTSGYRDCVVHAYEEEDTSIYGGYMHIYTRQHTETVWHTHMSRRIHAERERGNILGH